MGLLELIELIGEKNISVQVVNQSFVASEDKQECTEVAIMTQEITTDELMKDSGKVGLIVWISREDANRHLT